VLKRRKFLQGRPIQGEGVADVSWFRPDGGMMTEADWNGAAKVIGLRLAGDLMDEIDDRGEPIVGDTLYLLFNDSDKSLRCVLPATNPEHRWELLINTADDHAPVRLKNGGEKCTLSERSVKLYRTRPVHLPAPAVTPRQMEILRKESQRATTEASV